MDRLRFGAIILVVFSMVFAACAADASKLKVPADGNYLYWIDYTDPAGKHQGTNPEKFKGKQVDLDLTVLGEKPSDAKVTVLDLDTGNVAEKAVAKEQKDLALTADDFQLVRSVDINITSKDGKPVESALVTLTDAANKSISQVLDPTSLGVVHFSNVAAGQCKVTALYEGRKKVWDLEVPIDRETPVFSSALKIAAKVSTVSVPEDETAQTTTTKTGKPGKGVKVVHTKAEARVNNILTTLLGVLLLIVIVAAVIIYLKSKQVTVASSLKAMGVNFPEEGQADYSVPAANAPAAPQVDPSVCQFCGQKKDASGNCACSVIGTPSASKAAGASNGGEPRLIGTQGAYAGSIFPITTDIISVGREDTNMIALPQDATTSRRHATISRSNGGFIVRDEGSSNGTFVNGARVAGTQDIRPGDEVQFGSSKFRFETF